MSAKRVLPNNIEFCPGVDFDTTDCHAMGWGKDAFGDADGYQEYNQFLRSVKLQIGKSNN